MKITFIAFDLGGVLVDVDHHAMWNRLGAPQERVFEHHDAYSRGTLREREFVDNIAHLGRCDYDLAHDAWAAVVKPFPEANALVDDVINRGYGVAAWSNTDPIHGRTLQRQMPAELFGPGRALSFENGALKPELQFYADGLNQCKVSAENILFVDDRRENVKAAKTFGIHSECVRGIPDLRQTLARYGVL